MTDFQTGRVSSIHFVGERIESLQETYQKELNDLSAMKIAFAMASRCLEEYRAAMLKELNEAKLTIKEAEYGKTYITKCVELINNMYMSAEAKRLRAEGASDGLKQAVASVKRVFDDENNKLQQHVEHEKTDTENTLFDRPLGAHPGQPLNEYVENTKKQKKRDKR